MKNSTGKTCSCGTPGVYKKFVQFDYWYCPKCRTEIKEAALPVGYLIPSGAEVTTECCGEVVGVLNQNLPADKETRRDYMVTWHTMYNGCFLCQVNRERFVKILSRPNLSWSGTIKEMSLHIKDKGWV